MDISKEIQEMEESTNENTRGLEVSEKKQDQWDKNIQGHSIEVSNENGVKVEDESGETLCLQHSELKDMELSTPEELPSGTNIRELITALCIAHMAPEEQKTEGQMKKLQKGNRRQRMILKKLTEERGEKCDQEFETLRLQDSLCQNIYMRRIKKQNMRMEELIRKLRGAPWNSTTNPAVTATTDGNSIADGESDRAVTDDDYSTANSDGDKNSDDMQDDSHRGI
jgi:hypothetical protein